MNTTLTTVKRGSTTDDYSDVVDNLVTVYTNVPARMAEKRRRVQRNDQWMSVTTYEVEVTTKYVLVTSDVLTDRHGLTYVVDEVNTRYGLGAAVVRASCTRLAT